MESPFRENQRAEDSGPVAEFRRNNIITEMIRQFSGLDISVEQRGKFLADPIEQARMLHNAAADNNALGGQSANPRNKTVPS